MKDLAPYPEHRETGLVWLGKVPRHWSDGPGFAFFREKKTQNIGMREKTVLSLSYGKIVVKPEENLHGLVPNSFETYQIVEPGDVIIRSTDLQNDKTSLRVGLVKARGIITSAYMCMRATDTLLPEYGYLLLHAFDLTKVFYGMGSGLRQNLAYSDFKRLPLFVPPQNEQADIVRFLNHVNHRIERTIRSKRKVIALLNEQKQVIIHRAVTRGIDSNVRLKPSGIPWLEDIPEHWSLRRNCNLFKERNQRGQVGLPVLVVSLRSGVTVGSEKNEAGREKRLIADQTAYKLARKDDLAYNMMRMWQGAVGVVPVIGLVSPAYVVAQPLDGVLSNYYELLFRTDAYKGEINRNSRGIVSDRNRLYWADFKKLLSPLPPYDEQLSICDYLSARVVGVDQAISRTQREIDLLREYRTRLTSDVVTGKLDVREAAARLPEVKEDEEQVDGELDEDLMEGGDDA